MKKGTLVEETQLIVQQLVDGVSKCKPKLVHLSALHKELSEKLETTKARVDASEISINLCSEKVMLDIIQSDNFRFNDCRKVSKTANGRSEIPL